MRRDPERCRDDERDMVGVGEIERVTGRDERDEMGRWETCRVGESGIHQRERCTEAVE